jgi:small subunit ribosomal protein S11
MSSSSATVPSFFEELLVPEASPSPKAAPPRDFDEPPTAGRNSFPKETYSSRRAQEGKYNYRASEQRPRLRLYFQSTRNNTIATLTRANGDPICWLSGGKCGFKKSNRNSYEAGYQCAVGMFKRIEEEAEKLGGLMEWELVMKEFGMGRKALISALQAVEGENVRDMLRQISDRTAIKVGGTRSKKARRL